MSRTAIDPRPLEEIQGRGDEANTAASWHRRGALLAADAVKDWPWMDYEAAARAADCFTIAAAIRALPTSLAEREGLEPEAWLIREIRGDKVTVMCGQMFKSEATARAAAIRLTNGWRLCQAFPVASLANL